jgi:hypothetical protein
MNTINKTFLGLQINNYMDKAILVRRFKRSGVWTIPHISFDGEICGTPLNYIERITNTLTTIGGAIELISLIPVVSKVYSSKVWDNFMQKEVNALNKLIVYNMKYKGIVSPNVVSSYNHFYDHSSWLPFESLNTVANTNPITEILIKKLNGEHKNAIHNGGS